MLLYIPPVETRQSVSLTTGSTFLSDVTVVRGGSEKWVGFINKNVRDDRLQILFYIFCVKIVLKQNLNDNRGV